MAQSRRSGYTFSPITVLILVLSGLEIHDSLEIVWGLPDFSLNSFLAVVFLIGLLLAAGLGLDYLVWRVAGVEPPLRGSLWAGMYFGILLAAQPDPEQSATAALANGILQLGALAGGLGIFAIGYRLETRRLARWSTRPIPEKDTEPE